MKMAIEVINKDGTSNNINAERERIDDELNLDKIIATIREANPDWEMIEIIISQ